MGCFYLLPASLLMSVAAAQNFETDMGQDTIRSSVAASMMNITFSEPSTTDCGQNNRNSLTISIRTVPEKDTCFNLEDTFTNTQTMYSTRGYTCKGGDLCGVNYTVTSEASAFDTSANYSQIFYTQVENPFAPRQQSNTTGDENDNIDAENQSEPSGRLVFETYNAANCKQDRTSEVKQPYYEWNCNSEQGTCDTLPFGVKSFAISMMDPERVGDVNCTVAQQGGSVVTVPVDGWAALAVAFVGIAYLV